MARYHDRTFTGHCGRLGETLKLKLLAEPQNRWNFLIRGFKTENPPAEVADGFVEDRPLRTVSTDQQISGNNLEPRSRRLFQ
jgi:hypothetical protein